MSGSSSSSAAWSAAHHRPEKRHPTPLAILPILLATCTAATLAATPARADRHVAAAGSDTSDCSDPGLPCASIAFAVGQATAGEVVHVGAGSFAGAVTIDRPLTLRGAQSGVAVASRTAGSTAESIVDARGLASAISISSGDVVVEGIDVLGDALTFAGVVIEANANLAAITVRDSFVHGMALANPSLPGRHVAHGIFAATGSPGDRRQLSGLTVQGNDIFALGAAGSVSGVGMHLFTVAGASAGDGATITGNRLRALASRDVQSSAGAGVIVDAGTDDLLGAPTAPSSGLLLTGNTYADVRAGAIVYASATSVAEAAASFGDVPVRVIDVGGLATVDATALGRHATSDALTGYSDGTGYFATIQAAVDASQASATVRPTAHDFAETVTLSRGIQLAGPRAGEDARSRDPLLGEATVSLGVRIRAEGATVDGISVTNLGGVAVHADALAVSATVRNVRVADATRGIALDRAQSATVTQNLIVDVAEDAIAAGSDGGTPAIADDVPSQAIVQDNEVAGASVGVHGYLQTSLVSRNLFRDYPELDLGAGIAGALIDSVVERNTVRGFARGAGILLTGDPNRPLTRNTTFRCNEFVDSYFGVLIELSQTSLDGILVRGNTIAGNTIGALSYPAFVLDATNNWWGCAGGPGTAGCDVAGQNVDFEPFLATAPDCATCTSDTDCDDGLFCNGEESCDPVIHQCLPGTPPTCDLGGADPQCNVASCDQTFGCVAIPVTDGTTCDLGTACSAVETCNAGACIAGPGAGDDDGDGICNADDTCPSCDFPLVIDKARLVRNSSTSTRKNGKVVVKASFVAPIGSPGQFDVSGPISLRVRDGAGLSFDAPFAAGECKARRNVITCKSADRRFNLRVKPFRPRDGAGIQLLTFTLAKLDIGPTFTAPVTVLLRHGAGISRTGSIATCQSAPGLLRCS